MDVPELNEEPLFTAEGKIEKMLVRVGVENTKMHSWDSEVNMY